MMQGENVSKLPLYNQRKEAVEYIVPEEIPIENVTLVGRAKLNAEGLNALKKKCAIYRMCG